MPVLYKMLVRASPEKLLPKPLLMCPLSNGAYPSVLQVSTELYKAMYRESIRDDWHLQSDKTP